MNSERILETFSLMVVAEDAAAEEGSAFTQEQQQKRVLANLPAMLEDVEENLGELLPEGFAVRIRRWDSNDG